MPLTDVFNDSNYRPSKLNDNTLQVYDGNSIYTNYDFAARMVITRYSNTGVAVTPFAQMDPETLETMREKLIELKGNPPPLPGSEAPVTKPATARKLNA